MLLQQLHGFIFAIHKWGTATKTILSAINILTHEAINMGQKYTF